MGCPPLDLADTMRTALPWSRRFEQINVRHRDRLHLLHVVQDWTARGSSRVLPGETLMRIEIEREDDGRWIAEIPDLPGAMVYGMTREEALAKVEALALRVIADRLDHGEAIPELDELFAVAS